MHVIHDISAGRMTAKAAGAMLGLSVQQVRRLIKKQRERVDEALRKHTVEKIPVKQDD
jgi:DNA-directed RNA polymerase specialized sigma subunit